MMKKVKDRLRGASRISAKNQVTLPVDAMREAGLQVGERLIAKAVGPGRVVLEREDDVISEIAGKFTGLYSANEVDELRAEWE